MDAVVLVGGGIGATYVMFKGISELPKIADGLEDLKKRLGKELAADVRKEVSDQINSALQRSTPPTQLPTEVAADPVGVSCSIDARPLLGLTPDVAKSHAIHLSVAASRFGLSVENLSDSAIENLRVGLFKSSSQRHSWEYSSAFSTIVARLGGKQTVSLAASQFVDPINNSQFDLTDIGPLYVDCWLQDNAGIYLFNFLLE